MIVNAYGKKCVHCGCNLSGEILQECEVTCKKCEEVQTICQSCRGELLFEINKRESKGCRKCGSKELLNAWAWFEHKEGGGIVDF